MPPLPSDGVLAEEKIVRDGSRGYFAQMVSFTLSQGDWKWFSFTVPANQLKSMVGVDWNVRSGATASPRPRTSGGCKQPRSVRD